MNKLIKDNFIDENLSINILDKFNSGLIGNYSPIILKDIPDIDSVNIIDLKDLKQFQTNKMDIDKLFNLYNIPIEIYEKCKNSSYLLDSELLRTIGIHLYDRFSYGVLNGGSATSYVDIKKNRSFNKELFNKFSAMFEELTPNYKNRAKGITPGFINPNGIPGPSFMELKMRSLLLEALNYKKITKKECKNLFPMFQMTSTTNNDEILKFYETLKDSIYLKELIRETGIKITDVYSAIQPLISAYSHSNCGSKKSIFLDSNGKPLALPGGHGQCFFILKGILQDLYNKGIRFISIGNVDNLGYTLDPITLAILAITNKNALFEFSYKTIFDVKGGVLIRDQFDKINCTDLGVSITESEIKKLNKNNSPILFNCATGLFNLSYLLDNIDEISNKLPTRFTDQSKDIGEYSQAEQVTWEVISLLDDFLILAVDKFDKFLASKLLIENLITSGVPCEISNPTLNDCAITLNKGLNDKLKNQYNLILQDGEWIPND